VMPSRQETQERPRTLVASLALEVSANPREAQRIPLEVPQAREAQVTQREAPQVQVALRIQAARQAQEAQMAQEGREDQEDQEDQEAPQALEAHPAPAAPEDQEAQEDPQAPQAQEAPQDHQALQAQEAPQAQEVAEEAPLEDQPTQEDLCSTLTRRRMSPRRIRSRAESSQISRTPDTVRNHMKEKTIWRRSPNLSRLSGDNWRTI